MRDSHPPTRAASIAVVESLFSLSSPRRWPSLRLIPVRGGELLPACNAVAAVSPCELTTLLTTTMTTVPLPDTSSYATVEVVSCLVTPSARAYGSRVRFHTLRIRHGVRIACSEPSRRVQFVQLDQHKRLASDFASA
jgi:hypothetical protein